MTTNPPGSKPQPPTGPAIIELAQQWADNKIHVYQFSNAAEYIVKQAVDAAVAAAYEHAAQIADSTHPTEWAYIGGRIRTAATNASKPGEAG